MKTYYLTLFFIFINLLGYSQQNRNSESDNYEATVDTIYAVDTIRLAPDPNLVILTKAQYDSLMMALNKKEESSTHQKEKVKEKHWREVNLVCADYLNLGIKTPYALKNNYFYIIGGYNFNEYQPFIAGLSYCRKMAFNPTFSFNPEIQALWYFPTQKTTRTQSNYHLLFNLEYLFAPRFSLAISPSLYVGWRNNVDGNAQYNEFIHIMSPYKPFYAKETSSNSTFDVGCGLMFTLSYKIN